MLLDPEYLYVDPESLKVWLCLVPGMECDFPEDYSRFLEYLLGKVDHRDKESVVLAYGLYQETRKENYGMTDILRLAQQKSSVSGPNHKTGQRANGKDLTIWKFYSQQVGTLPGKNRWKKEIMCKEADRKMAGSWEQCAGSRSRQTHRKNQLVCWQVETEEKGTKRRETERTGAGCADALGYHRI